jgi:hypothetical protein
MVVLNIAIKFTGDGWDLGGVGIKRGGLIKKLPLNLRLLTDA